MQYNKQKKKIVKIVDIIPSSEKRVRKTEPSPRTLVVEIPPRTPVADEASVIHRPSPQDLFPAQETADVEWEEQEVKPRGKRTRRIIWWATATVIIATLAYLAWFILPKVDIRIVAKKVQWASTDPVIVNTNINTPDSASRQIPGEILTEKKTTVATYKASGQKYVERKAHGTITIVNAYSSTPQPLVATTRFQAPDGRIFRLANQITVPGARVTEGKIEPSSIDAAVVADKTGSEYNIGPVEKFTIPGFTGSDKFGGFYGLSRQAMSGGFIGTSTFPTDQDIAAAKEEAQKKIRDALMTSFTINTLPSTFAFVKGSEVYTIKEPAINTETDENGMFSAVVEGTLSVIAFKPDDASSLLRENGLSTNNLDADRYEQKNQSAVYGKAMVDWAGGKMTLPVEYTTTFAYRIDADAIKKNSAGKKELELKTAILSTPGVDKLTVSFWPFWVQSVPKKLSHISVVVE